MAKHKRSRRNKADANSSNGSARTPWSDLEQNFFASAPPDEPRAPDEPERFDDLVPALPARPWTERVLAALTAPRLDHRIITIAIASFMFLIGLSAVVFASRH
jgi:hypothetical protein